MLSIIILAIIQALTEFIPVSSSGHLLAVQEVTSLDSSLALDVALHFGTLLALVVYFADRIRRILTDLKGNKVLITNLILTSIPAAFFGFIFQDVFQESARNLGVVIIMMMIVGVVMIFSDSKYFAPKKKYKKIEDMGHINAYAVGLGQALALIPGTSRSGITMLTAKSLGLSNKLAAEYSFLAGIPIIAGATLRVFSDPETNDVLFEQPYHVLVGVLLSFGFGWIALKYLIEYVSKNGLKVFGWYRLGLAAVLLIIWL